MPTGILDSMHRSGRFGLVKPDDARSRQDLIPVPRRMIARLETLRLGDRVEFEIMNHGGRKSVSRLTLIDQ
jgi:cold shock CspA family protein